jgi:sugar diacid utilization regulator
VTVRFEEDDISSQKAALAQRREDLAIALADLAVEAKKVSRTAAKRGVDLNPVYAAVLVVERAEEAVDMALTDVASASGHDV